MATVRPSYLLFTLPIAGWAEYGRDMPGGKKDRQGVRSGREHAAAQGRISIRDEPILTVALVTLVHCRHLSAEIASYDGLPNSRTRALLRAGDLNCQTERGSGLGRS